MEIKIFCGEAKTCFGQYLHTYRGSFHKIDFWPSEELKQAGWKSSSGASNELIFNTGEEEYKRWSKEAEKVINKHHRTLAEKYPSINND